MKAVGHSREESAFKGSRLRNECVDQKISVTDPVYWVGIFLLSKFSLEIENFPGWKLQPVVVRLWGWKPDTLRQMFETECNRIGYPKGFLRFHSLQSGSITNRIIVESLGGARRAIETSSMIPGWTMEISRKACSNYEQINHSSHMCSVRVHCSTGIAFGYGQASITTIDEQPHV